MIIVLILTFKLQEMYNDIEGVKSAFEEKTKENWTTVDSIRCIDWLVTELIESENKNDDKGMKAKLTHLKRKMAGLVIDNIGKHTKSDDYYEKLKALQLDIEKIESCL